MPAFILDHLDDLKLPEPEVNDHYDARMVLARLGEGLSWIHGVVAEVERQTRREAEKENTPVVLVAGVLEGKPIGILSCAFQWYAVSACNYAQLVGWLATRDPRLAKEYVGRVMPRLLKYRNKVAAHFALTDPLRESFQGLKVLPGRTTFNLSWADLLG